MNETTKKAVAYLRISSVRQIDNESPDTQREIIQKYAETQGFEIIEWFFDEAKSGKNADREELNNLIEFALKYRGKIDHVLVYKMNRMSRDIDSYITQVKVILKARGITIRSATEPIDDTITGRMMESLLIMLGQMDNEVKAGATIDNMRSLALQGYWQHPPILGYDIDKIENDSGKLRPTLKPNLMAGKVKEVLERYSLGNITKAELARYAKQIGLRSRYSNTLSEDTIYRMLKNPTYAGYVSDKFTEYELVVGKHPAIIATETYQINQTLLHSKNSRKGEVHLSKNKEYPLRGLLLCSNCQNLLYASAPTSATGKRSPRYHCARKSCTGKVSSVKASIVHDDFMSLLNRIKPNEGILKLYKTVMIREANNDLDNLNMRIGTYRNQLDRISDIRSSTIKKFVEGSITQAEKNDLIDDLEKQKLHSIIELQKFENQQTLRESDIEHAINFMRSIDKQWEHCDLDLQHKFQSMIFPRGLVYNSKARRFGTNNISELYRCIPIEKGSEEPSKSDLVAGVGLEPTTSWL
jgi:site-specific DNA recombinase